jgi:hypothetical protein
MSNQTPQKNGEKQDIKLKLAGASYVLGDAAMMIAGKIRGENNVVQGGAIWMAGGIGTALFGNPKQDTQLRILSHRLERHLKKNGIEIPNDARAQAELLKKPSVWQSIELFLYEHPSEILNAAYAVGAGFLLHHGVRQLRSGEMKLLPTHWGINEIRDTVSAKFWIGALVMAGALSGLLIKEDPEAKKKAEHGNIVDKVVAFATEKPLRVSGALYTANNAFLALDFAHDISVAKTKYGANAIKPHNFSGLQLACYLFANTMLLMSPRNQVNKEGFSETEVKQLQEAAASIIAAQPKETQNALMKDMSEFMSKQAGITVKPAELEAQLKEELHRVTTQSPAERRFAKREAARAAAAEAHHSPSL